MLSRSELLRAIDKFYVLAQTKYSFNKFAAEDLYQEAEDISYKINDEKLLEQFEAYLETYKEFLNSINISPQEISAIFNPNNADKDEDNFKDFKEAISNRWQRFQINKYLSLSPDNPDWVEPFSPTQIKSLIDQIKTDVDKKYYETGAKVNMNPDDMDNIEEYQKELAFEQVAQEKAPETIEDKETQRGADVMEQRRRAGEKSRGKIKAVRDRVRRIVESLRAKGIEANDDIGLQHLIDQRAKLEEQAQSESNLEKKKELQRILNEMPNPESYIKNKASQKASFDKIMSNEEERKKYFINAYPRLQNLRARAKDFEKLTEDYDKGGVNEKARAKAEMIRLMKKVLEGRRINLNDSFILNSPEIQAELNPENIMAKYRKRDTRIKDEDKRELGKRQKLKSERNLPGLIIEFRERINNIIKDTTDSLNRILGKEPIMKPYKEELAKAKSSGDQVAIKNAIEKEKAFLKSDYAVNFRNNHQMSKDAATAVGQLRAWRDLLTQLSESGVLNNETISLEIVAQIQQLINAGHALVKQYARYGTVSQRAMDIITYLKDRIS